MISIKSKLNVSDNCGAKKVYCIKIAKSKKKMARRGDIITVAIKKLRANKRNSLRIKKGDLYKALLLRTKIFTANKFIDIGLTAFCENSILLLNKQNKLIGSRVNGPISKQFKGGKFTRFFLVSTGAV